MSERVEHEEDKGSTWGSYITKLTIKPRKRQSKVTSKQSKRIYYPIFPWPGVTRPVTSKKLIFIHKKTSTRQNSNCQRRVLLVSRYFKRTTDGRLCM